MVRLLLDLLFYVPPIVCGVYVLSLFCYALLSALSSFAIILTRKKRVLVALLRLDIAELLVRASPEILCCVLEQDINPWLKNCLLGRQKFVLIVFLVFLDCKCSVALLHGAVGLSTLYDCGISCSCVLFFFFYAFPSPK